MKKTCFIIICIMIGAFTAFGQTAVSSTTDSEIVTEQQTPVAPVQAAESAVQPSQEDATALPKADTPAVVSADNNGKTQEQEDIVQPVEMNEPTQRTKRRPFSLHTGFAVSTTAANNIASALDFFKPTLVIDLNRLANDTIKSGMHIGAIFDFDYFFRFTVLEEHTVKFSVTANGDVWGNLPKSLLDIAANGNKANANGETITGTFNAKANVFADMGIMYQLTKPRYGFSARVAYFAPIAYMENPEGYYSLSPHKAADGNIDGITLKAGGTANVYGALPDYLANGNLSIVDILKNGGLDLSLTGMFRPTNWVTVTGGVNYLPLMPVVTTKGMRASFNYEGSVTNLLGSLGGGASFFKQTTTTDSSGDLPEQKVMRPCKIRVGADFRPFQNDYLILSPFLAFPVLNAKPYYIDGGLKIESRFARVLGVYLDTGCVERMWRHELCLFMDSRWFTFNLGASVASQDFKRTFTTLSGLGIKFGVGIGF